MTSVNITDLRQHLPAWLARVRRGQSILVTSRGKVIAQLAPPPHQPDEAAAARALLRGSVRQYRQPLEPAVDPGDWDANR